MLEAMVEGRLPRRCVRRAERPDPDGIDEEIGASDIGIASPTQCLGASRVGRPERRRPSGVRSEGFDVPQPIENGSNSVLTAG